MGAGAAGADARPGLVASADWVAAILVLALGGVIVATGLRADHRIVDIDQLVYERTLRAMRGGADYYSAMRQALILKEGAPPTQIRSIRFPTLFLLLRPLPQWMWRWAVGAIFMSVLAIAWRLGRFRHPAGGPVAVMIAAIWLLAAAPLLYLHAEVWGLPFAMAGVLAARDGRWARSALLIGLAVAFRELYAVLFVFGFLFAPRRRPWLFAGLALAILAAIHVMLASAVLSAHGREAPFGAGARGLSNALSSVSPSDRAVGTVVGLVSTAGGLVSLALRVLDPENRSERMVLAFALVMIPATIVLGRVYWALCFGPLLACYVPQLVLPAARRGQPDRSGVRLHS